MTRFAGAASVTSRPLTSVTVISASAGRARIIANPAIMHLSSVFIG